MDPGAQPFVPQALLREDRVNEENVDSENIEEVVEVDESSREQSNDDVEEEIGGEEFEEEEPNDQDQDQGLAAGSNDEEEIQPLPRRSGRRRQRPAWQRSGDYVLSQQHVTCLLHCVQDLLTTLARLKY